MIMKEIQISEFKAHCLSLIRDSREPIIVSSRGKRLAVLTPYREPENSRALGQGAGLKIKGDILDTSEFWKNFEKW